MSSSAPDPHEHVCGNLCVQPHDDHGEVETTSMPANFGITVGATHYILGTSAHPAIDEITIKASSSSSSSNDQAYITFRHGDQHINPRVVDSATHRTAFLYYPMSMLSTVEDLLANRTTRPVAVYVQFFGSHIWASIEAAGS